MTVLSTLRHWELSKVPHRCWYNAILNRNTYLNLFGVRLHWVVGASRYHAPTRTLKGSGFMDEQATMLRTKEDLKTNWDDTHAWLEDDEGYVYDYLLDKEVDFLKREDPRRRRWKLDAGFIEGQTYAALKAKGYELIPFPHECRQVVIEMLIERQKSKAHPSQDVIDLLKSVL